MKKYLFITTLFAALLAVSCGNSGGGNKPGPDSDPEDKPELRTVEIKASDFGLDNQGVFKSYSYLDLTISADKGEGIDPKYFTTKESLRLYKGNSLAFSAAENITEIEFTFTNTALEIAPNVGELVDNKWTGEDKSVCFSVITDTSGYIAISVFKVTYYSYAEEKTTNSTTFDFASSSTMEFSSITKGEVTISASKGAGVSTPKTYDSGDLRIYKGNVLTFTSKAISKIQFTISTKEDGAMSADVGEFYGTIWLGDNSEINFTVTDGQRRIQKIVVYHEGESGDEARTIATVAQDVLEAVFYGETNYNQGIEWIDGEAYIARKSDETTLVGATEEGVNRVSRVSYLEYLSDTGIVNDIWEDDGAPGAFAYFIDEDYDSNFIMVEIGSYEEYGVIFVQYCVYLDK